MPTASDLLDLLATAVAPPLRGARRRRQRDWWPGGLFIREIEAPQQYRVGPRGGRYPLKARRADAIWVPHNREQIHGYEVKISRADLQAELEVPEKAIAWQQYCNTWSLLVPGPELVEGFDIPETWGVIGPPSGRRVKAMTVYRKAPVLKPIDQAPALFRLSTTAAFRAYREKKLLTEQVEQLTNDRTYLNEIVAGYELGFELEDAA